LSQDPEATIQTAARLAAAWIVFQMVLELGGGTASLRRFGVAVTINSVLLALFALVQSLTWNGKVYWVRPTPQVSAWFSGGPFICHNHLAAYLNLGLGLALGFLLNPGEWGSRRRGDRLWAAYAASVILVGIIASHSRSGLLAMV